MIAALSSNRVIGVGNRMPWRLPRDMKHFVATTMGKPVIMGRKTFESIGKPLKGRTTIILTRNDDYEAAGCLLAHSIAEALLLAGMVEEVVIAGGENIYRQFLPHAHRLYLTYVQVDLPGDTFFPEIDKNEWQETGRKFMPADNRHAYGMAFVVLERRAIGNKPSSSKL